MHKHLIRLSTLLLVPALLADPLTASALMDCFVLGGTAPATGKDGLEREIAAFQEQALMLRVVTIFRRRPWITTIDIVETGKPVAKSVTQTAGGALRVTSGGEPRSRIEPAWLWSLRPVDLQRPPGYPPVPLPPKSWKEADDKYVALDYTAPSVLAYGVTGTWENPQGPAPVGLKNPLGPTGYRGRGDLWYLGANPAVDLIFTSRDPRTNERIVLTILREDARKYSLPGVFLLPGEDPQVAIKHMVKSKLGISIDLSRARIVLQNLPVRDWRNTDDAWVVTMAIHIHVDNPDDLSLEPRGGVIVARWRPLQENLGAYYSDHGTIIEEFVRQEGTEDLAASKTAMPPMATAAHPQVIEHASRLDFSADRFVHYAKGLSSHDRRLLQAAFLQEFLQSIRGYAAGDEWRTRSSELPSSQRRYFLESDEQLQTSLERTGFYESAEYFMGRIVSRFLATRIRIGPNAGRWSPVRLDPAAPEGTGHRVALEQARSLIKDMAETALQDFQRGRILLPIVPTLRSTRWALKFNRFILVTVMEESLYVILVPLVIAVMVVPFIATGLGHPGLAEWLESNHPALLELLVGILVTRFALSPIFERMQEKLVDWEERYYGERLESFILGTTPHVQKIRDITYDRGFKELIDHLCPVGQAGSTQQTLEHLALLETKRLLRRSLRRQQRYVRALQAGLDMVRSGLNVDANTVLVALLKELAENNPREFEDIVHSWKRRQRLGDLVWKVLTLGQRNTRSWKTTEDLFLTLEPLVRIQLDTSHLNALAEQQADEALRASAAPEISDYVRNAEIVYQRTRLLTGERTAFDGAFMDHLVEQCRVLPGTAERRVVILSYFAGSGLSLLKSLQEKSQGHQPIHSGYLTRVTYTARVHWNRALHRIGENPEEFGLNLDEVREIESLLSETRTNSLLESLNARVFDQLPAQVYTQITKEIKPIVIEKSKSDPLGQLRIDSLRYGPRKNRVFMDLFSQVLLVHQSSLESLGGIIHDAYMYSLGGVASVEADPPDIYRNSERIDARLFDRTYNAITAPPLIQHLAKRDFTGKSQDAVNIFLGNLFEPECQPHPTLSRESKLTFWHLKPVQDYLSGELSRQEAVRNVIEFYRLGKNLRRHEPLSLELTRVGVKGRPDGFIESEFKILDELHDLQSQLMHLSTASETRRYESDSDTEKLKRGILQKSESIQSRLRVIVNPLAVPWTYLIEQAPRFGAEAEERKAWLISQQSAMIGVVGILKDPSFFDEFEGDLGTYWHDHEQETSQSDYFKAFGNDLSDQKKRSILKLRKLMRYAHGAWSLDSNMLPEPNLTNRSFDWMANEERVVETDWLTLERTIHELGLDADPRFTDVLAVGEDAATQQRLRAHGIGTLSDVIRTTPLNGHSTESPDVPDTGAPLTTIRTMEVTWSRLFLGLVIAAALLYFLVDLSLWSAIVIASVVLYAIAYDFYKRVSPGKDQDRIRDVIAIHAVSWWYEAPHIFLIGLVRLVAPIRAQRMSFNFLKGHYRQDVRDGLENLLGGSRAWSSLPGWDDREKSLRLLVNVASGIFVLGLVPYFFLGRITLQLVVILFQLFFLDSNAPHTFHAFVALFLRLAPGLRNDVAIILEAVLPPVLIFMLLHEVHNLLSGHPLSAHRDPPDGAPFGKNFFDQDIFEINRGQGQVPVRALMRITEGSTDMAALGNFYSRLKYGSVDELKMAAERLAETARVKLNLPIGQSDDWVVVTTQYNKTPAANSLLAQEVAKHLNLPVVMMKTNPTNKPSSRYSMISSEEERRHHVSSPTLGPEAAVWFHGKKIILVDDCYVTGTAIASAESALKEAGVTRVEPFVVAYLDGHGDHSVEFRVNGMAHAHEGLMFYAKILNDPRIIPPYRLIKNVFRLNRKEFTLLSENLTASAILVLYLSGLVRFGAGLSPLADILVQRLQTDLQLSLPDTAFLQTSAGHALIQQVQQLYAENGYRFSGTGAYGVAGLLSRWMHREETGVITPPQANLFPAGHPWHHHTVTIESIMLALVCSAPILAVILWPEYVSRLLPIARVEWLIAIGLGCLGMPLLHMVFPSKYRWSQVRRLIAPHLRFTGEFLFYFACSLIVAITFIPQNLYWGWVIMFTGSVVGIYQVRAAHFQYRNTQWKKYVRNTRATSHVPLPSVVRSHGSTPIGNFGHLMAVAASGWKGKTILQYPLTTRDTKIGLAILKITPILFLLMAADLAFRSGHSAEACAYGFAVLVLHSRIYPLVFGKMDKMRAHAERVSDYAQSYSDDKRAGHLVLANQWHLNFVKKFEKKTGWSVSWTDVKTELVEVQAEYRRVILNIGFVMSNSEPQDRGRMAYLKYLLYEVQKAIEAEHLENIREAA